MSKLRSYNQVWGTCNGFELLTVLASEARDVSRLTRCRAEDIANHINLAGDWRASGIYGQVRCAVYRISVMVDSL